MGAGYNARDVDAVRRYAEPVDIDRLLEMVADASYVLIGEASHGTHEFYELRARLSRRLVTDKGLNVITVEGDWPDAFRVNRYVRGRSLDTTA